MLLIICDIMLCMIKKILEIIGALASVLVGIYSAITFWASGLACDLGGSAAECSFIRIGSLVLGLASLFVLISSIKAYNGTLKKYPFIPVLAAYGILIVVYVLIFMFTSHPALSSQ